MKIQKDTTREALELGSWMGKRQMLSTLAGRCSAADAQCLREIRDRKQYRTLRLSWDEFCARHLGICRRSADRIIRDLNEFGTAYFELAAVTRITPEEFRRIRGAVGEGGVKCGGEVIALLPENSARLAAAVETLQREAAPAPAAADPLDRAGKVVWAAVDRLEKLLRQRPPVASAARVHSALGAAIDRLRRTYAYLDRP